jgi:UTP--glucose-1-phosphate uridylyltransferase
MPLKLVECSPLAQTTSPYCGNTECEDCEVKTIPIVVSAPNHGCYSKQNKNPEQSDDAKISVADVCICDHRPYSPLNRPIISFCVPHELTVTDSDYNEFEMNFNQERRTESDRRKVRRVRKAIFPAAGLGTRFLPATKAQPKEMLPLVDKPIIQYGVEEALAAGCDQIIIITGRGKSAIEDHFDVSYELEKMLEEKGKYDLLKIVRQISDMIFVAYVRQKEALGLGHAVLTARELIGDEPFATLLADDVIDAKVPVLKQLMNVFDEKQCSVIATQVVEGPAISSYGVLKAKEVAGSAGKLFEVIDLVEKPKQAEAPSNLAVIGRYILTPTIFETLSDIKPGAGGELQLTDGLRGLLQREKMYAYVYEGRRHDTGDKLGFLKATVEFALKREDLGAEFREYLRTLKF